MAEARLTNMWTFVMESNYEDLGDICADMKCTICARILINAQSAPCGCRYCLDCVKAYLKVEGRFCAGNMDDCQLEKLDINKNIHPDQPMNHKISKLIVGCRYSCGFRCELRNMEDHETACRNHPTNCPYVNVGCTETQLVSDRINEHLVGESVAHATLLIACIDRLQEEMASMSLARDIDQARTNEKMERIEEEVANMRNENKLVEQQNSSMRAEMERHRAEQLAQVRAIELLREKCSRNGDQLGELERQVREEKEELRRNIDLVREEQASGHDELERRVQEIGATVALQNQGGFDWRIDGWAAKSQSAREGNCKVIFSETFYSHENGYRMCLSVFPHGGGPDEGSHLAVAFHLMRGPFDSFLSWPFKRDVTISLIDQRTGIAYVSRTRTFDDLPNSVNRNKPETDRNAGFGTSKLVELVTLSSTAGLIQDDTIFIRCIVKGVTQQ